jgi:hypothetical protein
MSNRVVITIDLPDGVVPDVQYQQAPRANVSHAEPPLSELPPPIDLPDEGPLQQAMAEFPPMQYQPGSWRCPEHGTPAKLVPGGVAASSGKAYTAFEVCSTAFCKQKPPKRRAA